MQPVNGGNVYTQQPPGYIEHPYGSTQQSNAPTMEDCLRGDFDDMGPEILRSSRHPIVPRADQEAPAFRTLHSLEGLLESHHSITTPSSSQHQGTSNRIMSSMLTVSNFSRGGSGNLPAGYWSPIPASLMSTSEHVLDRDTKVLSKDWVCDILSSAPEWSEQLGGWSQAWAAHSTAQSTAADARSSGRGMAASGLHERKSSKSSQHLPQMEVPHNPAASSMRHAPGTGSFDSQSVNVKPERKELGGPLGPDPNVAAATTATSRVSRPPQAQVPRSLMATMPHEGVLQHAREAGLANAAGMANTVAIRNGRAPATRPPGPRKLARRPPRLARSRVALRRASMSSGNRPAKGQQQQLQGVDYSKLQTALEVLADPTSRQPSPNSATSGLQPARGRNEAASSSFGNGQGGATEEVAGKAALTDEDVVDDGTCEERVKLLGTGKRRASGWDPSGGASARWTSRRPGRSEVSEMHQEEMQALYWKQKSLVDEAAAAAADLEADQADEGHAGLALAHGST